MGNNGNNRSSNESDILELKEFLLDSESLLSDLEEQIGNKVNIFDILSVSRTEIRHSNILAWLLNPFENHGLSSKFTDGLLALIAGFDETSHEESIKLILADGASFSVYREWNHIDLLLVSEKDKLAVCIENKIDSGESDNQLNTYRKKVKEEFADSEYSHYFLYLTLFGEEPSDSDNWTPISYSDDISGLIKSIAAKESLSSEVSLIINHYLSTIGSLTMENSDKIIELCRKIDAKHRHAIDLIVGNRYNPLSEVAETINDWVVKWASEERLVNLPRATTFYKAFTTNGLTEILPDVIENKPPCIYFIGIESSRIFLTMELQGIGVNDTNLDAAEIVSIAASDGKKPLKKKDWGYKRIVSWDIIKKGKNEDVEAFVDKFNKGISGIEKKLYQIITSDIPAIEAKCKKQLAEAELL
ncbi:MAG: PD-(D/E)XK nuclease family protein [Oscillospiraceae bacterium]|jgi:hypothetical protein|nr:PD-(D/E)XK nuclease family protein [Oscillospiraceae bacterium]